MTQNDAKREALDDLLAAGNDLRREVRALENQMWSAPWLRHLVRAAGVYDQAKQAWELAQEEARK